MHFSTFPSNYIPLSRCRRGGKLDRDNEGSLRPGPGGCSSLVRSLAGRGVFIPPSAAGREISPRTSIKLPDDAGRHVSVSFPDDVYVVIIIIMFRITTIINAATSVIYPRAPLACITRAGEPDGPGRFIATLPVYSSILLQKRAGKERFEREGESLG